MARSGPFARCGSWTAVPEHRAAQLVSRTIIWQIVATAALIGAVVLLQLQQAAAQRSARVEQTTQLREGCARSVAQDFEALGTNRDLAGFARDAATARRSTGDAGIARRYARRARDAEARVATIATRLPASEDPGTVREFCAALFPVPTS
jgi:hypothetical protein